ncbi:serine protease inhibitor A3M-like isoform X1 [Fundulus heteroclitus]|uniref:serine protease inhibitor A3M-like isoform X1 n=2 Tax=Fundulus heteroclitus TaxID=8078 RepID=UPI00165B4D8F|nr:serine protease inhibitor A3M-like isoform X1 [Fundulus heteroclitus]
MCNNTYCVSKTNSTFDSLFQFTMHVPLALWILSAVVCVGRSHHHIGHGEEAQGPAGDGSDNKMSLVTSANKEFAFRLYTKLADHASSKGKNIFFSPVSVSTALAALMVGARGETHQQLFRGMGFSSSQLAQTDVDQAFRTLLANKASHEDLSQGTAVFVDNRFNANPEFLDVLKQSYSAEGFNVDFANTTESADTINQYVSGKTNGKIDKLVESLDPSTVMYLLSYIYYKGKWETPFNPRETFMDRFRVDESNEVQVQMMTKKEDVKIYDDQAINTKVLHLPFNNSYSMLLLLPDNMAVLERNISPAHVTKWLKWTKSGTYRIFVPKFSIKTSYELNDVLTGMGMADMFGDRANLSGIADCLFVSKVVHQATLDVDEAGATAAAAATGIKFRLLSSIKYPELRFNRPFMVIITERVPENILFIGKIVNPNL